MDLRDRFRKDYSAPITRSTLSPPAASTPPPTPPTPVTSPSTRSGRRKLFYFFTVLVILGGILASGWFYFYKDSNPIPMDIRQKTNLTLYYPSVLPEGYVLNKDSFRVDGQIITFSAESKDGKKILFTLQERPQTFDFQTFYQQGLTSTEQFTTPSGQAAVGKSPTGQLLGNMVSDRSWVIVTSNPPDIPADDLRLVLNNLKKSN